MNRRFVLPSALAAIAALALTGCGTSSSSSGAAPAAKAAPAAATSSSAAASTADLTAWSEKFCGVFVNSDIDALASKEPKLDASAGLADVKRVMLGYLGTLDDAMATLVTKLHQVGPAPDSAGTQIFTKMTSEMQEVKTKLDSAKARVAAASTSDPTAFQAAFQKVATDLSALDKLPDPTAGLQSDPALDEAGNHAPSCVKLNSGS